MLNYNKLNRQGSNQKTRSKSIYGGNKSHTTSMNLRVSADILGEFVNLPLKNLINRNDQKKYQQKYKLQQSKQNKQPMRSDQKQAQKSKSNKKLKTIQQMTPQQTKLTSRGSFMEKPSPSLRHKNSIIALQTERYSREKSWKKNEQKTEKYDRLSMSKQTQGQTTRLKTDYIMAGNNDQNNYEQTQLNNMYNQMMLQRNIPQRPYLQSHHQHQNQMTSSKSINLFNVKKDEPLYPPQLILGSVQTVEVNYSQFKSFVQKMQRLKDQREQLKRELVFYKQMNKKQKLKNSVFLALR